MRSRCLNAAGAIVFPLLLLFRGVPASQLANDKLSPASRCRRAEFPGDRARGTNRVTPDSWDPLYRLQLTNVSLSEYTVSIEVGSRLLPFSDSFISAETNGSCGVGEFRYRDDNFFNVKQPSSSCPFLLTTNRKSVMQQLPPLQWKAPGCGCVHFRAMVIEASAIYYVEQPGVTGGPLASTICVGNTDQHPKKLAREEREELLCRVMERFSGLEVHQRPSFLQRRRLQPRYIDVPAMELALSTRRDDIRQCCRKSSHERRDCFHDIRRRRVDSFCEDGSPDIPFTVLRSRFMRQREDACCWRLGEARYQCFSVNADTKHGSWSMDLSLDETDPLNDLGDFPEEIHSLEKEYGMSLFPREAKVNSDRFSTSAVPPPLTSTITTTINITTSTTTRSPIPAWPAKPPPALGSVGSHRRQGNRRSSSERLSGLRNMGVDDIVDRRAFASREILEQGGRSIDKTFSKLQKRMWKLSLKTQCCEAGVTAARATYGNFNSVWTQCTHSSGKYLAEQRLQLGHKMCSSQFQKCCMEMAISIPAEVVTLRPDSASSREWDRDRHLVNKLYLPPHSRAKTGSRQHLSHPTPGRRARVSSAERKARTPVPLPLSGSRVFVEESEVDEEPKNKHPGRLRKQNSRERTQSLRARLSSEEEEEHHGDTKRELNFRRQRRLRTKSSREGGALSRGSQRSREVRKSKVGRKRPPRNYIDNPDIDEEPRLKKAARRRLSSGGRSRERRNRMSKSKSREMLSAVSRDAIATAPNSDKQEQQTSIPPAAAAAEKQLLRHWNEKQQLKTLLEEIDKDISDDEDKIIDEELDDGSEENLDSLGLNAQAFVVEKDDSEEKDEDESDEIDNIDGEDEDEDTNEDVNGEVDNKSRQGPVKNSKGDNEMFAGDAKVGPTTPSIDFDNKQTPENPQALIVSKTDRNEPPSALENELPSHIDHTTTKKPIQTITSPKFKTSLTTKTPEQREGSLLVAGREIGLPKDSQTAAPQPAETDPSPPIARRVRPFRARHDLSEEDGHHSGGRSSRRKRKNVRGRKKPRRLRHQRRMRGRHNRKDFGDVLEED